MSKIYYIMGKSATGKDTIYKNLLKLWPKFKTIVPYTTRPSRQGERDGVEYFFTSPERLEEWKSSGKIIELRTYDTVMGPWSYFTVDDGQFETEQDEAFLMIGTPEAYKKMCRYFGQERIVPLYIEVPDGERLMRAVERESTQNPPNYREVCRRYLADEDDFSEENLAGLGINKRFLNRDIESCLSEILGDIRALEAKALETKEEASAQAVRSEPKEQASK